MLSRIKNITKSKFFRNVAIVATGTAGAQAITMVFSPILTRLYGPEAFGMLGTFVAILAVFTPIAALTYPIAIVLPKFDADARRIAKLSALLSFAVAIITMIILLIAGDWIAQSLKLESIKKFIILIPLIMLFAAFQQIFTQWLIRKKEFKITAKAAVMQALAVNFAKAGFGWFHPAGTLLIAITTLGQAFHALILYPRVRDLKLAQPDNSHSTASLYATACRYKDFPLYRAPQVSLNALSQSLPVFILASLFGPAAAGFYTLGTSVIGIPSALIGNSVANVFYPRISEAGHKGENSFKLLLKVTSIMAAIGIIPFGIVVALGPWLFSFFFGSEWSKAGEYSRWLAIWLYFGFLNRPSVVAVATFGLQGLFLSYEIASVLIRVIAVYIGFMVLKNDIVAIAIFSISGAALNIVLVVYILIKSRKINRNE